MPHGKRYSIKSHSNVGFFDENSNSSSSSSLPRTWSVRKVVPLYDSEGSNSRSPDTNSPDLSSSSSSLPSGSHIRRVGSGSIRESGSYHLGTTDTSSNGSEKGKIATPKPMAAVKIGDIAVSTKRTLSSVLSQNGDHSNRNTPGGSSQADRRRFDPPSYTFLTARSRVLQMGVEYLVPKVVEMVLGGAREELGMPPKPRKDAVKEEEEEDVMIVDSSDPRDALLPPESSIKVLWIPEVCETSIRLPGGSGEQAPVDSPTDPSDLTVGIPIDKIQKHNNPALIYLLCGAKFKAKSVAAMVMLTVTVYGYTHLRDPGLFGGERQYSNHVDVTGRVRNFNAVRQKLGAFQTLSLMGIYQRLAQGLSVQDWYQQIGYKQLSYDGATGEGDHEEDADGNWESIDPDKIAMRIQSLCDGNGRRPRREEDDADAYETVKEKMSSAFGFSQLGMRANQKEIGSEIYRVTRVPVAKRPLKRAHSGDSQEVSGLYMDESANSGLPDDDWMDVGDDTAKESSSSSPSLSDLSHQPILSHLSTAGSISVSAIHPTQNNYWSARGPPSSSYRQRYFVYIHHDEAKIQVDPTESLRVPSHVFSHRLMKYVAVVVASANGDSETERKCPRFIGFDDRKYVEMDRAIILMLAFLLCTNLEWSRAFVEAMSRITSSIIENIASADRMMVLADNGLLNYCSVGSASDDGCPRYSSGTDDRFEQVYHRTRKCIQATVEYYSVIMETKADAIILDPFLMTTAKRVSMYFGEHLQEGYDSEFL